MTRRGVEMSGQLIIVVWGDYGARPGLVATEDNKIMTLVNFDALNAEPILRMIQELGVEDQEGQVWKYKTARMDLGSSTPSLDVFMEED